MGQQSVGIHAAAAEGSEPVASTCYNRKRPSISLQVCQVYILLTCERDRLGPLKALHSVRPNDSKMV